MNSILQITLIALGMTIFGMFWMYGVSKFGLNTTENSI